MLTAEAQLERAKARWRSLGAAARLLLRVSDVDDLLTNMVALLLPLLRSEMGAIGVYDPGRDVLEMRPSYQFTRQSPRRLVKPDEGAMGRAFSTREPVLSHDYGGTELQLEPWMSGVDQILAVPILDGDEALGALVATRPKAAGLFDEDDLELATTFAAFAALALRHARMNATLSTARGVVEGRLPPL